MKRLWQRLGSVKLTVWLMLVLVAFCVLGSTIPQKGLLGKELYLRWKADQPGLVTALEWVRLTDIYRSPLAYGLLGLFFLNLLAGMSSRANAIWRRCALPEPPQPCWKPGPLAINITTTDLSSLSQELKQTGYKVTEAPTALAAVKYRWTPLATFVFHLGFLLLLVGGTITFYTRFRAEADLAVGEPFTGEYTRILRKPLIGNIPKAKVTVKDVTPYYHQRHLLTDLQVLMLDERGIWRCGINTPYNHGTLSFVINRIDVAPLVVIRNANGEELDGAHVKLKIIDGKPDDFTMLGYKITARLLPNLSASGKQNGPSVVRQDSDRSLSQPMLTGSDQPGNEDRELVDPAIELTVEDYQGAQVASGMLRPGQHLSLGDSTLALDGLAYWVHFYVGAERGLSIVYSAFGLMVGALLVRFGLPRQEIRAALQENDCWLEGKSEYSPALFQEKIERLAAKLSGERA